ncbi:MAG TPA: branched-chain amino acid ABC transporter permease [Kofleriaceae bacterium]|jgi:branched-chain amino acid transport system permease protein|nr:branched-chain amino acid ABC transporter permease [Kofleriaceae bacterium]
MMRAPLGLAAVLAAAIVLPFLVSGFHAFQLTQLVVYAIAILGLNLLTGFSGQISLGNGAFYALGAYVAAALIVHAGVPYWLAPPLAGAVCFVAGYLFGLPAARLEGLYLALATFALAVVMPQLLKLDALARWTGGSQGVLLDKPRSPWPAVIDDDRWLYLFCLAVAVAMFAAAWNLVRGRTGRALIALRDHPIAAGAMGIDIASYKATAFGVSSMYTGVAGALGAIIVGFISPDSFTFVLSIQFLVGGVVGGIASIGGTLFGAGFIELVPNLAKHLSDDAPGVIYGVLLIVCMKLMPGGLAGLVRSARRGFAGPAVPHTRS